MASVAKAFSAELEGIHARLIEVETDIHVGLHSFAIVGLADKALSEAKERVNAALKNTGVKAPSRENRRIVVNLAPADVKKTGSQYDLAIALGYLAASGQIKAFSPSKTLFIGELSLEGKLRPVHGVLSMVRCARAAGFEEVMLPFANAEEGAVVAGIRVIPVRTLEEAMRHLEGTSPLAPQGRTSLLEGEEFPFTDIGDIKGHEHAKRALTIAAAGGHNVVMTGPPGTGKTMLAQALASILPSLTAEEIMEVTEIYSAAGLLSGQPLIRHRPFRAPHQSASLVAIVGGGQHPKPGEMSLAHRGVLFLDELPEFHRDVLEALRQPLERGSVLVSRVKGTMLFPARFMLAAAMNPCPCGFYGDDEKECRCTAYEVAKYQKKISGPFFDRIDIHIHVPRITFAKLRENSKNDGEYRAVRSRVSEARRRGKERFESLGIRGKFVNAELGAKECERLVKVAESAERFLGRCVDRAFLSARGYFRILKVAQTIADLEGSPRVEERHVEEAFSYRVEDRGEG